MAYLLKVNELRDTALAYNLNPNTFMVMKSAYPEKFEYMRSFNKKNFMDAYSKYLVDMSIVFEDSKIMYNDLRKKRLTASFGRYLDKKGIYKAASFSIGIKYALYGSKNGISYHNTYLKFKRILKLYPKFLETID